MSKISKFFEELESSVKDFSQLNVRTFSGDLSTIVTDLSTDLSNMDDLLKSGITNGNIKIEASTTLTIDGDINQFISTNISGPMKEVHDSAVDHGKDYRHSIFEFFIELV